MAYGFGYNAFVGWGTESVYGTPLGTCGNYLQINTEGLSADDDVVQGNDTYNNTVDVDNYRQGRKKVGGNISFDLRRQGGELFWKYAMGTVGTAGMATSGTVIERTYTIPDTLGTSLYLTVNRDVNTFIYSGVKINQFTINGNSEGIATVDATVIAANEGTIGSGTPSFTTSKYWMFQDAGLTYGGTTRNIKSWKVSVNQNLADDRYHWGTRTIKEPQRAGRIEVTGEMEVEFDGSSDWNLFQSAGTAAMVATYTGDVIEGTVSEKMTITLPKVRLTGGVPNVSDSGIISYTAPFTAYGDGTTKPLTIVTLSAVGTGTDCI
jgi:hypothetical protein